MTGRKHPEAQQLGRKVFGERLRSLLDMCALPYDDVPGALGLPKDKLDRILAGEDGPLSRRTIFRLFKFVAAKNVALNTRGLTTELANSLLQAADYPPLTPDEERNLPLYGADPTRHPGTTPASPSGSESARYPTSANAPITSPPSDDLPSDDQSLPKHPPIRSPAVPESLTWPALQAFCHQAAQRRASIYQDRYRVDLYLTRRIATQALLDFLASDRTAYVLTGKSGVGKTSLMIATALAFTDSPHCTLMYDAYKWDPAQPVEANLATALHDPLRPSESNQVIPSSATWLALARSVPAGPHRVVVWIDALNESTQSRAILGQINNFIEKVDWPWLKIVISCRTEAWSIIRRGIRFSPAKYYIQEQGNHSRQATDYFDYSHQLTGFSREELPDAYERYRHAFHIETHYDQLPAVVKEEVSDPLVLRLLARTYSKDSIPKSISVETIYQDHFDDLLKSGTLGPNDIHLLENDLLPLMMYGNHYSNIISGRDVASSRTRSGQTIFELIHDDSPDHQGRPKNQSFVNLVDAEILTRTESSFGTIVRFKYERFYDYFAGRRLYALASTSTNRVEFYLRLSRRLEQLPFLIGATLTAIRLELVANNRGLVQQLARYSHSILQSLLASALQDVGRFRGDVVLGLLHDLVGDSPAATELAGLTSGSGVASADPGVAGVYAPQYIAIAVAAGLGIPEVLFRACLHESPVVRAAAARHVFYLSNLSAPDSVIVLQDLAAQATTRWRLPNRAALEACLAVSILLYFKDPDDLAVRSAIASSWRRIAGRLFPLYGVTGGLRGSLSTWCRHQIFRIAVRVFMRILNSIEQHDAMLYSRHEVELFFRSKTARLRYAQLIPYFDVTHGQLADVADLLHECVRDNDMFTMYLATVILTARLVKDDEDVTGLIECLFQAAFQSHGPGLYVGGLLLAVSSALLARGPSAHGALWAVYEQNVDRFYAVSQSKCIGTIKIHRWMEHGRHLYLHAAREGHTRSALTQAFVDRAQAASDWPSLADFLRQAADVSIGHGLRTEIVDYLLTFVGQAPPAIDDAALAALAKLRAYHPLALSDIFMQRGVPEMVRRAIALRDPGEQLANLAIRCTYQFWRERLVIRPDPELLRHSTHLIAQPLHVRSADACLARWAEYLLAQMERLEP